jgi:Ku70/Ku80 beta-barrel domain
MMTDFSHFFFFCSEMVKFSVDQLSAVKKLPNSANNLRLLGFKPMHCLKDYHNLRPSTFIFPSDEVRTADLLNSWHLFIVQFSANYANKMKKQLWSIQKKPATK